MSGANRRRVMIWVMRAELTHPSRASWAWLRTGPAASKPAQDGKIVFISLGMSNAAGVFGVFKDIADRDPQKSADVSIVNCAIGGAGVSSWASPGSGT